MEIKAGRELDALVAQRVFGWTEQPGRIKGLKEFEYGPGCYHWLRSDVVPVPELPHYSTSIADAWQVVEKLKQDKNHIGFWLSDEYGDHCCPDDGADYPWFAAFCLGRGVESSGADTPSLAICLAALKAVGHEKT